VVNRFRIGTVTVINGDAKQMKAEGAAAIRTSISFPPDMYETLEVIAKEKKVSLAWVVREAAERYIAEKWPLFAKRT
jgi:predicted DNA-binding protein